ncbi:amino acid--tRNA ligase-related protein [Algiphilus sp.]|uniref:amino acid--tRNA ligase-related protein n=1 Tax=Algiphilus sp. TaxID=1872431 RepID=UPI0025BF04C5|nr:amino acid--tRNA ligase-related protein [Algiphilus sp.]MCK5770381.1 EF-P lysine aminoacylase GenX [Algiphilus sp.]
MTAGRDPASTASTAGRPDLRHLLQRRAALLARIRAFFAERGATEVDAPLRAPAVVSEPHIRALACEGGWLLPSPEYWLKRLLADGSGDVYQLAHAFRGGESGRHHAEEFLLCEWYRLGRDEHHVAAELDALLQVCDAPAVAGRLRYADAFRAEAGIDPLAPASALAEAAVAHGLAPADAPEHADAGYWRDLLMGLCVQPRLGHAGPVLLTGYPAIDSPLACLQQDDPRWSTRFELFWRGVELANGCRERRGADLPDGSGLPEDFPECAGVALGVDRLLMLLLGADDIAAAMPIPRAQ